MTLIFLTRLTRKDAANTRASVPISFLIFPLILFEPTTYMYLRYHVRNQSIAIDNLAEGLFAVDTTLSKAPRCYFLQ